MTLERVSEKSTSKPTHETAPITQDLESCRIGWVCSAEADDVWSDGDHVRFDTGDGNTVRHDELQSCCPLGHCLRRLCVKVIVGCTSQNTNRDNLIISHSRSFRKGNTFGSLIAGAPGASSSTWIAMAVSLSVGM